jgi:hypothetical protein
MKQSYKEEEEEEEKEKMKIKQLWELKTQYNCGSH